MSAEKFISDPKTPEEFASNVRFQLENVEGFLGVYRLKDAPDFLAMAALKAECLKQAATRLEDFLRTFTEKEESI